MKGVFVKVTIEPDLCIGCEVCVDTCPDVYKMDDDKAIVIVETVPEDKIDDCTEAIETCPVDAITSID